MEFGSVSDLYKRLQVDTSASQAEIRRAYHRLAMVFHPDKRPGDKSSETEFKNIVTAFEILGDPEARALYDNGRIDFSGRPIFASNAGFSAKTNKKAKTQPFESEEAKAQSKWKWNAGQTHSSKSDVKPDAPRDKLKKSTPQSKQYKLAIGFVEACLGTVKKVRLPNGQELKISIPAGVDNGQRLRVNGETSEGTNFVVKIVVEPHMLYTRRADDICIEVPLTPYEACFGATFEVPSVHGALSINVPCDVNLSEEMRIEGFGVRCKRRQFGDLLIKFKVVMPDHWPAATKTALKQWSETAPYNPRSRIRRVLAK